MSQPEASEIDKLAGEIDKLISGPVERRSEPRYPFRVVQKMAPIRGGIQAAFHDVMCSDISASGISFYLHCRPDFEHFAMVLQTPSADPIKVLGQVVGHEPVKGLAMFLVRCQLTRRLEYKSA